MKLEEVILRGTRAAQPVAGFDAGEAPPGSVYYVTDESVTERVNDAGTAWEDISDAGTAGSVATDAIWDAAGDLAVGSGANTAARLAIGAAGGALSRVNGVVAWNSGTSFPTAAAGDRYWRTDHGREYQYDGTRWRCTCLHLALVPDRASAPASTGLGVTGIGTRGPIPIHAGASDIWIVDHGISFFVIGGTALSASHKWVGTFDKVDTSNASTTIVTDTIDSGTLSVWRRSTQAVGALVTQATYFVWQESWTKTGTPGNLIYHEWVSYQIVAT